MSANNTSYDTPSKWNFYPGSPDIEDQTLFTPDRKTLNGEKVPWPVSPNGLNTSIGNNTPNKWTMFPEQEVEDNEIYTPERMTLKERFEYGRMLEKKRMEEKLRMYRQSTAGEVSRHIIEDNVWGEAIKEKKAKEEERQKQTLKVTPSRRQLEEAAEIKKNLAQLTHVTMQREPTKTEVYEVFHSAKEACVGFDANLKKDIHDVQSSNTAVYLNTTHIYTVNSLNAKGYQIMSALLQPDTTQFRPVPLLCGAYGDGSPEIRPVAIAFKLDEKTLLIALRIIVSAGYPENSAYGLRRIAVCHTDDNNRIFERIINILPEPISFDSDELPAPSAGRHAYFGNTSDNPNAHHQYRGNDLPVRGTVGNYPVVSNDVQHQGWTNQEYGGEYGNSADNAQEDYNGNDNNNNQYYDDNANEEELYGYREGDDPEVASQEEENYEGQEGYYDNEETRADGDDGAGGGYDGPYDKRHNNSYDENYQRRSRDAYDDYDNRDYDRDYQGQNDDDDDDDYRYNRSDSRSRSRSRSRSDDSRSYSDDDRYHESHGDYRSSRQDYDDDRRSNDSFDYDDDVQVGRGVRYANSRGSASTNSSRNTSHNRNSDHYRDDSTRTNYSGGTSSSNYGSTQQGSWGLESPQVTRGFEGGSNRNSDGNRSQKQSVTFKGNDGRGPAAAGGGVSCNDTPKKGLPYVVAPSDTKFARSLPATVPNPIVTEAVVNSRLSEVKSVSASTDTLVLGIDNSAIFFQEPSLQPAPTNSITLLSNGKIFQWTKGIYMKGWLLKWPTKNQQSMGRLAKRYFVLKDNVLSYHKIEIEDDDDMLATPQTKFFPITADCQVKIGMHNMQKCMKIITTTEKIWVALNGENEMEIETRWVTALNAAIEAAAAATPAPAGVTTTAWSIFQPSSSSRNISEMLKPTAPPADYTYKWYLTDPSINIVSCDANANLASGGFVRVALYEQAGVATVKKGVLDRRNVYSVDIGTDVREKMHLQIVLTNESPVLQADLSCVKLFGDMLILGGKQGFVGIGSMGLTTGVAEGVSRKVMYSIACKQGGASGAGASSRGSIAGAIAGAYPHSATGAILALAAGKKCNIFAAADTQGIISLWYLNKDDDNLKYDKSPSKTNLGFYYKIKPALQATVNLTFLKTHESKDALLERVVSMEFFNCDRYLMVHTNKRLVLLVLSYPSQTPNYLFDAWVEVDRVPDASTEARFAFSVKESETRQHGEIFACASQIVSWRVSETSNAGAAASASRKGAKCGVVKTEWTSDQFMKCVNKIKYL